ncbi:diphthine--ammonia ligase [Malassezia cuniculi]|uniref:Diphthine--ammonia ligase n=1 Tax=Malassezia cuniculi TaxID=948313 RepID=A0AAF0EQX4_9BASI|nr:diphthine--ammonia ligase [Malassezia cuniculi]
MKVVGLLSGGKDSCFNLCHCVRQGHELVALATLAPPSGTDELDSYMYQTVGHDAIHVLADAMRLPLYRATITGSALNIAAEYGARAPGAPVDPNDETEDLFRLLLHVKHMHPDVEAVSVGAILSNYQRVRVEHVALRPELNLVPLAFLWQRNQSSLLAEMVSSGLVAILIKVAGIGLTQRDLGKTLLTLQPKLEHLHDLYDAHVCGEGGEYETLALDAPIFARRVHIRASESVLHSDAAFASVSYLRILDAELLDKHPEDYGDAAIARLVHAPPLLDPLSTAILDAVHTTFSPSVTATSTLVHVSPSPRVHPTAAGLSICGLAAPADGSFADEAAAVFTLLHDTLAQHQLAFHDVSHINVYLASQHDFAALNAVYMRHFGVSPPSRAAVAVPMAGARLMLDASASRAERRALHVQSRSYWAPANIGPYSQAAKSGARTTIAGQIGLVPASMALCTDAVEQTVLALQHARRIVLATREWNYSHAEGYVEAAICWIARDLHTVASDIWGACPQVDEPHPHQHLDDASWRGSDAPLLVVQVQPDGLPRGAVAEWQLTTNSGRTAPNDPDAPYTCPKSARGSCTINNITLTYWTNGTCGAAILTTQTHDAHSAAPPPPAPAAAAAAAHADLIAALRTASHVRQFHAGQQLLEHICSPAALTDVPALAWSLPGAAPSSSGSAVFWLC